MKSAILTLSLAVFMVSPMLEASQYSLQPTDPYAAPPAHDPRKKQLNLDIRVINHGAQISDAEWLTELETVERVYSQCDGIDFHLHVVNTSPTSSTTLSDNLIEPHAGVMYLTQAFLDFFQPWVASRPKKSADVHLVDYLSAYDRQAYEQNGNPMTGGHFGQAFHPVKLDRDYQFMKTIQAPPKASAVAGNTVALAMTAVTLSEKNDRTVISAPTADEPDEIAGIYVNRSPTLLAHELGHLLMNYDLLNADGNWVDHACPGAQATCPPSDFLTAGGTAAYVVYENLNGQRGKTLGYSPLAQIEPEQCALLKAHPLIYETVPSPETAVSYGSN